jgi:hypothetical protein
MRPKWEFLPRFRGASELLVGRWGADSADARQTMPGYLAAADAG